MDVNHPDDLFVYYRKSCLNYQRTHCSSKTWSVWFYESLIVLHKVTPDIYQPAPTSSWRPCISWCITVGARNSSIIIVAWMWRVYWSIIMWHTINATARNKQPLFESGRYPAPGGDSPIVSMLVAGSCPHSDSLSIRAPGSGHALLSMGSSFISCSYDPHALGSIF